MKRNRKMQGNPSEHGEQDRRMDEGVSEEQHRRGAGRQGESREGGGSHESDDLSRGVDSNEPGQSNPQRLDRNTEDRDQSL